MENSRRRTLLHDTMKPMHPFDLICFDGDGRGSPELEPDDAAVVRARWQALNAVEVPTIR